MGASLQKHWAEVIINLEFNIEPVQKCNPCNLIDTFKIKLIFITCSL